jgi:cobaltochelatase CobN
MAASVPQASWELSSRGLSPLETAINVAIPEFDGRIITVPISFKERQAGDGALYKPHQERIARVAGIAARLVRLLAGVDWRLIVLLKRDKGSGKSTGF